VQWESSTKACFFLTNVTTGTGGWDVCHSVNIPYDHTSAEWVNENHIPEGAYYDDPGTVSWSGQIINSGLRATGSWKSPFTGSFLAVITGSGLDEVFTLGSHRQSAAESQLRGYGGVMEPYRPTAVGAAGLSAASMITASMVRRNASMFAGDR
jgi:hypothetical protein